MKEKRKRTTRGRGTPGPTPPSKSAVVEPTPSPPKVEPRLPRTTTTMRTEVLAAAGMPPPPQFTDVAPLPVVPAPSAVEPPPATETVPPAVDPTPAPGPPPKPKRAATDREWDGRTLRFTMASCHGYLISAWDGDRLTYLDIFVMSAGAEERCVLDAVLSPIRALIDGGAATARVIPLLRGTRFAPNGSVPGFGFVSSLADLLGRWIEKEMARREAPPEVT